MKASDRLRAEAVWHLAAALQLIGNAPEGMLEHRLRSVLRDGPCPDCPDCALHAALEGASHDRP